MAFSLIRMSAWASILATILLFFATIPIKGIQQPEALMIAAFPSALMFLGFWKIGRLEGRIFLQVMALLTAILIVAGAVLMPGIVSLASENYIFALYFFTAIYFMTGLLMLLFGSALVPVQVHYGGLATVAGIFGVITGIGYATIVFAPFAALGSLAFYSAMVLFLFRAAYFEEAGLLTKHWFKQSGHRA